ncbi:MAG: hypothetical protein JJV89_01890 [Desulfosarcina sp.]|nr:hypothetical protein [Desulfobacterales bacterium]
MYIKLNLGKHCIETEIKKLHDQSIFQYFKSNENREKIEKRLDILEMALERLNCSKLRSTYTELAGHNSDDIRLSKEKGELVIRINGARIAI